MSCITVYLKDPKIIVTLEDDTIRLDKENCPFKRIPLRMIERVVVEGKPLISSDVWRALVKFNIPAVIIPIRGKGDVVYLDNGLNSKGITERIAQHKAYNNYSCLIKIARWLLDEKLKGQISVIQMLNYDKLEIFIRQMNEYRNKIKYENDHGSLMGYEGAAASYYFQALAELIDDKWNFNGRNRRPPKDPVNALMSLGYVMAGSEVRGILQKKGLDPAIGFLHAAKPYRDNFVLDIIEPVRPVVDKFILNLINNNFTVKDFSFSSKDGCRLNRIGRGIFYSKWSDWQHSDEYTPLKSYIKDIITTILSFFPSSNENLQNV